MKEAGKELPKVVVGQMLKVDSQKKFVAKGLIIHNINSAVAEIEESFSKMDPNSNKESLLTFLNEQVASLFKRFVICFGLTRNVARDLSWRWPSLNIHSKDCSLSSVKLDTPPWANTYPHPLFSDLHSRVKIELEYAKKALNFCCVKIFYLKTDQEIPKIIDRCFFGVIRDLLAASKIVTLNTFFDPSILYKGVFKTLDLYGYKIGYEKLFTNSDQNLQEGRFVFRKAIPWHGLAIDEPLNFEMIVRNAFLNPDRKKFGSL